MRRVLLSLLTIVAISASRAEAITVRDVIELSKAGLGEQVLLALIEVDRSIFTIDTATLRRLKESGVTEAVIVAMIKSGRTPQPEPIVTAPAPEPAPDPREPQVIVIDHRDAPAPVAYPVAVPVYVPVPTLSRGRFDDRTAPTILNTDQGLVKARLPIPPNCIKAEPVYWGFDGKLRPGSWQPPPTVVCR
ncbi:MAG TPA: hypothetical protein VEL51_13395 [Vicinamibacterales bacterium]|nr:hypothetical protein [Vicinamibacterales bacterium]